MKNNKCNTAEKLNIFKSLFMGLGDVYGTYDTKTGRVRQVKEAVTDEVILAHLTGKQSYGVYLLVGDRTGALAVDFDQNELCLPISFVAGAKRYDISAYIERSKSKGYHVWIFFEKGGVLAKKARLVAHKILTDMGKPGTEMFPKQDALSNGISYGNFIHAPLFGSLFPKGRTVFVDPGEPTAPYPDQWELLARVQRVPEIRLDGVIKSCNLKEQIPCVKKPGYNNNNNSDHNELSFGLPRCVRRMLSEGVSSFQRVACYRIAVQLRRCGVPFDLALITLKAWAQKNQPQDDKRIITEKEIEEQTKSGFESNYNSIGCEEPALADYCDNSCPVYSHKRTQFSSRA